MRSPHDPSSSSQAGSGKGAHSVGSNRELRYTIPCFILHGFESIFVFLFLVALMIVFIFRVFVSFSFLKFFTIGFALNCYLDFICCKCCYRFASVLISFYSFLLVDFTSSKFC
jgi:hypothetical protein